LHLNSSDVPIFPVILFKAMLSHCKEPLNSVLYETNSEKKRVAVIDSKITI